MDRTGTFSLQQLPKGKVFLLKDNITPKRLFFPEQPQEVLGPLSESDLEVYPIVIP